MWELDHKEGWGPKKWCFQIMVLEKTLESPLDYKEIKPVNPKGNQAWWFIGRTDAKASILWPPHAESQLTGKDPDAGKDWGQEEKGATEDEKVGWHHRLNGHEFEQTPRDSEGQGSLECCSPWDHKKSDMAERLNNNRDRQGFDQCTLVEKKMSWTLLVPPLIFRKGDECRKNHQPCTEHDDHT